MQHIFAKKQPTVARHFFHLLVLDAKDKHFSKYQPLVDLLIERFPQLLAEKDMSDRTPLRTAISRKRTKLVDFICKSHGNIDFILGISSRAENYVHTAIRRPVSTELALRLISYANESTLCAKDGEGRTPLHLAVDYKRCTGKALEIVKALISPGDKAMDERTNRPDLLSPYRYLIHTMKLAQGTPKGFNAGKDAPQGVKLNTSEMPLSSQKVSGAKRRSTTMDEQASDEVVAAIQDYLKLHCLRTRRHDEALDFLYGQNKTKHIHFDLLGIRSEAIMESGIDKLLTHVQFEDILQYVALPSIRLERLSPHYKRRPKSDGKGRNDMDDIDPPHSDRAIEQALESLSVEVWDWQKPDIPSDTILTAAPEATTIYLYWTGNNAVLRSWSEPQGLCLLKRLKKIELNVTKGLEGVSRTRRNLRIFKDRLQSLLPGIELQIEGGGSEELNLVDEPVERVPRKLANKLHEWLGCMDTFANFIRHIDEPLPFQEPIKVALIDDGVDASAPSLESKIIGGRSFHKRHGNSGFNSPYYASSFGHGTVMASLICRVCPNAQLYVLKLDEVLGKDRERPISVASAKKAIESAISQGVHVILMPWDIAPTSNATELQGLNEEIKKASGAGILIFGTNDDTRDFKDPKHILETARDHCIFRIAGHQSESHRIFRQRGFVLPGYDAVKTQSTEGLVLLESCKEVTSSSVAAALGAGLAALILYCVQLGALQMQALNLHENSVLNMNRFQGLKRYNRMRETLSSIGTSQNSDDKFIEVWNVFGNMPREVNIGSDERLNIIAEIAGKLTKGHKDEDVILPSTELKMEIRRLAEPRYRMRSPEFGDSEEETSGEDQ